MLVELFCEFENKKLRGKTCKCIDFTASVLCVDYFKTLEFKFFLRFLRFFVCLFLRRIILPLTLRSLEEMYIVLSWTVMVMMIFIRLKRIAEFGSFLY